MIYHLASSDEWRRAGNAEYKPGAFAHDRFIHCSTALQLEGVVSRFFPGRNDLVVLCIDPASLKAAVKYEDSGGEGMLFPHIYGALNRDAIRSVLAWPENGSFPEELLPAKHQEMLAIAVEEARKGLTEGGIPIGAALFESSGKLLGRGHNRRVQDNDPSAHGETDAFRKAGRQETYRNKIMATTLAPCWYCSGLVRQFAIGTVIVGESKTFRGGIDWLIENGISVVDLHSPDCERMMRDYIAVNPTLWREDIGE